MSPEQTLAPVVSQSRTVRRAPDGVTCDHCPFRTHCAFYAEGRAACPVGRNPFTASMTFITAIVFFVVALVEGVTVLV